MDQHYYTPSPIAAHDRKTIIYHHPPAFQLELITDSNVFSRHEVDFGTDLLLRHIPTHDGQTILDLGCGYGVIGLSIAQRHPDVSVLMTDINQRAVGLAEENRQHNRIHNAQTRVSNGFDEIPETFDLIVCNPPVRAGKQVIYSLFADTRSHLREGGEFLLVLRKQQGAPSAQRYLQTLYTSCEITGRKNGYWILRCTQPASTPAFSHE